MPPIANEQPPMQLEVKIESFLQNTHQIFVELQVAYPEPAPIGEGFNIRDRMNTADQHLKQQVLAFIRGDSGNE